MATRGCSARASQHITMSSLTRTTSRRLFYRVPLTHAYVIVDGNTEPTAFIPYHLPFATSTPAALAPFLSQPRYTVNTFPFLSDIALVQTTNTSVSTN
jgi:hypothetical protein